jgi:hypothetical protein
MNPHPLSISQYQIPEPATPFDSSESKHRLFHKINRIPGLQNARIIYFDGASFKELRPYPPMCMDKSKTVVIRKLNNPRDITNIQHPQVSKQTEGGFYSELLSTGLSCGAAVMSWIVVGGSSAAIPVSGGSSTVITVLAYSAATASSLQCANSAFRLFNESDYGDASINRWLDSQDWYERTSTALDAISVAGGIASVGATLKTVLTLRSSGVAFKEALKGLSRQERKRLTEEIIRANNPNISNKFLKSLVAAGKYPKRFSNVAISNTMRLQLKDAIGASLSFTGSATSGVIRNPKRLPDFVIGIIEEFETY